MRSHAGAWERGKRRLLQQNFIETLTLSLLKKGILHIATDWQNYAAHITEQIQPITQLTPALLSNTK